MPRSVADADYSGYTRDPAEVDLPVPTPGGPPIGPLDEPADQPPAPSATPDDDPLVELVDRRVRTLGCYFHEGWRCARPGTLVRSSVADRLARAAAALPEGFGLAVFDAWRPLDLQAELFDAAYGDDRLPPGFIAEPITDPARPPAHLTGGAVDLTLTWGSTPLALGTTFDDFTDDAHALAQEDLPGTVRDLRRLLTHTLRGQGFIVLDMEWWHFEWGTRRWAAIRGRPCRYGPADPAGTVQRTRSARHADRDRRRPGSEPR